MMTYAYNPSTWEDKVGRLVIWGQLELYSKILSQNKQMSLAWQISARVNQSDRERWGFKAYKLKLKPVIV